MLKQIEPTLTKLADSIPDYVIYDDFIRGGWIDSSVNGTYSYNSTNYIYQGQYSIKVDCTNNTGILTQSKAVGYLDITNYAYLQFFVNGGLVNGQLFSVFVSKDATNYTKLNLEDYIVSDDKYIQANNWLEVNIPITALGIGIDNLINKINIQNRSLTESIIYIDNLEILSLYAPDDTLPVSVADIGEWMNLSPDAIVAHSNLITNLIKTSIDTIERYTWHDILKKTYVSYYELFDNTFFFSLSSLMMNRSPITSLSDILKIEYLTGNVDTNDSAWITIPTGAALVNDTTDGVYQNVIEKQEKRGWASLWLRNEYNLSSDENTYRARITYKTGYDINYPCPEQLKLAIKKIVAFHYVNRGDCDSSCSINGLPVPCDVKGLIDQYSVAKVTFNDSVPDNYGVFW